MTTKLTTFTDLWTTRPLAQAAALALLVGLSAGCGEGDAGPDDDESASTGVTGDTDDDDDDDDDDGDASGGTEDPTQGSTTGADDTDTEGSSETGAGEQLAPSLNQAAFNPATQDYEFGHNSIPTIPITGAPEGVDWTRWAMLHDGADFRLYFLPEGSADRLIQFGFNPNTAAYEYGFNAIPEIPITNAPADADPSQIAMLHDGSTYRLYLLSQSATLRVHQFGFDPNLGEYVYGHNSIPEIPITGTPAGANWDGWGMLHDGGAYRLYAFESASEDALVQHGFNPSTVAYEFGHQSIPVLDLVGIPDDSDTTDFAMLHDGADYRFYFLTVD